MFKNSEINEHVLDVWSAVQEAEAAFAVAKNALAESAQALIRARSAQAIATWTANVAFALLDEMADVADVADDVKPQAAAAAAWAAFAVARDAVETEKCSTK